MIKKILVLLILTILPKSVFATAQMPDSIIYKGETYHLFREPLESYFSEKTPRPDDIFVYSCTASWRGYKATWEIKENYLHLTRLVEGTCDQDAKEIAVSKIFPGQEAPVKAVWFSGELRIPQGKQLHYEHMGYESVYERDLVLIINNGKLIEEKIIDNTKTENGSKIEKRLERERTKLQIAQFEQALDTLYLDTGRYPTTEEGLNALVTDQGIEGWSGPYITGLPKDLWGNLFQYLCPGTHGDYDLFSYGSDGKPGGEGADMDITNWE